MHLMEEFCSSIEHENFLTQIMYRSFLSSDPDEGSLSLSSCTWPNM